MLPHALSFPSAQPEASPSASAQPRLVYVGTAGGVGCSCWLGKICCCSDCVCIYMYREWIGGLHIELLVPSLSHFVVPKVRRWLVLCCWWTERKRLLPRRSCLPWGSEYLTLTYKLCSALGCSSAVDKIVFILYWCVPWLVFVSRSMFN